MSLLRHTSVAVRLSSRTPLSPTPRAATPARLIASSSTKREQLQACKTHNHQEPPQSAVLSEEPQKLGKRARKALKARERQEQGSIAKAAKESARSEALEMESARLNQQGDTIAVHVKPVLKVKHVMNAAEHTMPETATQDKELELRRVKMETQYHGDPTTRWSGSLFRSHISSLLSGFGTSPSTRPLQENALSTASSATVPWASLDSTSKDSDTNRSDIDNSSTSSRFRKDMPSSSTSMSKSERMESQARVIFHAIREARERGMVDEDESFFYPYPEGVPPKDLDGKDTVWLNLGPDPEAWGRELPQVKDKWLEVLSLGLAKEINDQASTPSSAPFEDADGGQEGEEQHPREDQIAFNDLVEDYDLEDHERLEQLGDSIVNMSSRLLAYLSYPDVNEGSLTRLSNYPTQNNFLALLFRECGLAARRDELCRELRGQHGHDDDASTTQKQACRKCTRTRQTDEEMAQLPLLIKRDADMFEAYAAAVFLSHGNDFNVVHNWLCHLFRPFQDQAYRFMVQRSEALARMQANRAAAAAASAAEASLALRSRNSIAGSPTNLAADGLGLNSATIDPSSVRFSSLFPDFSRGSEKKSAIPAYALANTDQAFITDEFLTVAARARRQREERLREELRLQDQQELMKMGWFRKGFLNLRTGFRQYVMGKDMVREQEARLKRKINEQRGMSEKNRQRLRARERSEAGVSVKSTASKMKEKIFEADRKSVV